MALEALSNLVEQLPALRAEHERLGALIAAIEAFAGEDEHDSDDGQRPSVPSARQQRSDRLRPIGRDEFVGMSTSQAIRHFLVLKGKGNPQGPREMAEALVEGGRGDADVDAAYANVTSALKRMKKNAEVRSVRRGQWGLASWYGAPATKKANGSGDA